MPLIEKLGFRCVREVHGAQEHGKDIVATKSDSIAGDVLWAFVVKRDGISASAKKKASVQEIQNQVTAALRTPYQDIGSKREQFVSDVVVVCGGPISDNARTQILGEVKSAQLSQNRVHWIDEEKLAELIDQYWPDAFSVITTPVRTIVQSLALSVSMEIPDISCAGIRNPTSVHIPIDMRRQKRRSVKLKTSDGARTAFEVKSCDSIIGEPRPVLLVGSQGTGKSTLLKGLLLRLVERYQSDSRQPIPLLLRAQRLGDSRLDSFDVPDVLKLVATLTADDQRQVEKEIAEGGGLVLLIDGVDEIADDDRRRVVVNAIEVLAKSPRVCQVVMTGRPSAFQGGYCPSGFDRYEVAPLTIARAIEYFKKRFANVPSAVERVAKLFKDRGVGRVLPRTPMVLTLLARLLEDSAYKYELPANITELYAKYSELALGRWDEARGIAGAIDYQVKSLVLGNAALHMNRRRTLAVSQSSLVDQVRLWFSETGLTINAEQVLSEILGRGGLLCRSGSGDIEFVHPSFQSFFAATMLRDSPSLIEHFRATFTDQWWDLSNLFVLGQRRVADDVLSDLRSRANSLAPESADRVVRNVGLWLQAAFSTSQAIKSDWVRHIVATMARSLSNYCATDGSSSLVDSAAPKIVGIVMYRLLADEALSSEVLRSAIEDFVTDPRTRLDDFERWILLGPCSALEVAQQIEIMKHCSDPRIQLLVGIYMSQEGGDQQLQRLGKRLLQKATRAAVTIRGMLEPRAQ